MRSAILEIASPNMDRKSRGAAGLRSRTTQLKVVHVTSVHPVRDPRFFEKECRSLAEAGHAVVLVASRRCNEEMEGIRIRATPTSSDRKLRTLTARWRALMATAAERGDQYHLHDPELRLPFQFARVFGSRPIFDTHEHLREAVLAKEWVSPPFRRLLSAII